MITDLLKYIRYKWHTCSDDTKSVCKGVGTVLGIVIFTSMLLPPMILVIMKWWEFWLR